jgi:hypothetical protein
MTTTKTKTPNAAKVLEALQSIFPDFKFTYLGMSSETRPGKFLAQHKTISGAGLIIEMVIQQEGLFLSTHSVWPKAGNGEFQREFRFGDDVCGSYDGCIYTYDNFSNGDLPYYLKRFVTAYLMGYPIAVRRCNEYQTYLDTGGKALKEMCRITGATYYEGTRSLHYGRYGIEEATVSDDGSTVKLELCKLPLEDAKAVLDLVIRRRKKSGLKLKAGDDE